MSQRTRTVPGSCGLMVGMNCAPPPPGPIRLQPSGAQAIEAAANRTRGSANLEVCGPMFGLHFLGHHEGLAILPPEHLIGCRIARYAVARGIETNHPADPVRDVRQMHQRGGDGALFDPVSYTHLTLPTIYSV